MAVAIERAKERHWVGDGFLVSSVFSYGSHGRKLSPFLLFDYAAPRQFAPSERPHGVGEHPHRGFETVTVVYQGAVAHRDSAGNEGVVGPGDVQWMTAASGVVHEEFHERAFARRGGVVEMAQLWVNLPAASKRAPPRYQTLLAASIPTVPLGGGFARVIAGELGGRRGPAATFTPVQLLDATLPRGAAADLPRTAGHTLALFVRSGALRIDGNLAAAGELALPEPAPGPLHLEALEDAAFLVLGGAPIDEPIVGYGPFVMNTEAEIEAAFRDYESGRMGRLGAGREDSAASS